jgi:hypothetical protein
MPVGRAFSDASLTSMFVKQCLTIALLLGEAERLVDQLGALPVQTWIDFEFVGRLCCRVSQQTFYWTSGTI